MGHGQSRRGSLGRNWLREYQGMPWPNYMSERPRDTTQEMSEWVREILGHPYQDTGQRHQTTIDGGDGTYHSRRQKAITDIRPVQAKLNRRFRQAQMELEGINNLRNRLDRIREDYAAGKCSGKDLSEVLELSKDTAAMQSKLFTEVDDWHNIDIPDEVALGRFYKLLCEGRIPIPAEKLLELIRSVLIEGGHESERDQYSVEPQSRVLDMSDETSPGDPESNGDTAA